MSPLKGFGRRLVEGLQVPPQQHDPLTHPVLLSAHILRLEEGKQTKLTALLLESNPYIHVLLHIQKHPPGDVVSQL
jgi:hypothetical protein